VNISCPACDTVYRIDPANVSRPAVRTRCARCAAPFVVIVDPEANRPGVTVAARPASDATSPPAQRSSAAADQLEPAQRPEPSRQPAQPAQPAPHDTPASGHARGARSTADAQSPPGAGTRPAAGQAPAVPVFGPQDPETRARRLARALISDIKVYNRDRWGQSRSAGTLRKDFRDEILKSWEEYVEQVGESMAKQSPYFRDALNDILAAGERVF
jgi:predicted Zn finger-like uncharacterized protein